MARLRALAAAATAAAAALAYARWRRALRDAGIYCSAWRLARLRWQLRTAERLLIICDFDRTLTTARVDGETGLSCHGIVEHGPGLSEDYFAQTQARVASVGPRWHAPRWRAQLLLAVLSGRCPAAAQALFRHYHAIEVSHELTKEEKIPHMVEWYRHAHELMLTQPVNPVGIRQTVADPASRLRLRPGAARLVCWAHRRGVPLVVYTAGLTNVVREVLLQRLGPPAASLPLVGNTLFFREGANDANCHATAFSEPLVHMFNKDGITLMRQLGSEYRRLSNGKTVALLLGDSLGDAHMADGLEGLSAVCRIGFLNEEGARQAAALPAYASAFDALVLGDGPMDLVLRLLGA